MSGTQRLPIKRKSSHVASVHLSFLPTQKRCEEKGNHLEETKLLLNTEAPMCSGACKAIPGAQDLDINALKSSRLQPPVDGDQAAFLQTPAPQHG